MDFVPIPLTPFEWLMFEDCGQASPMTYTIRLDLKGRFSPQVFADAVKQSVNQHPLIPYKIKLPIISNFLVKKKRKSLM